LHATDSSNNNALKTRGFDDFLLPRELVMNFLSTTLENWSVSTLEK